MRLQFEQTLELLRQVLKAGGATATCALGEPPELAGRRSLGDEAEGANGGLPVDSRSLLLLVGEY